MKTLNLISKWLNKICGWYLVAAFSLMTVTYFGQIVLRYVFQSGLKWTEELTRYTNISLVMIGAAVMASTNSHINVSALESVLPKAPKKVLIIIQQIISVVFYVLTIFFSFQFMKIAGTQVSTNMRLPMRMVYGLFLVAFSILVFQLIVFILNSIFKKEDAQ